MVERMVDPARIAKLLVDKVTERQNVDRRRLRTNRHEEKIADYLLNIIDDVSSCVSYEVELETTLDHDDDEEFTDSDDESLDPNFEDTEDEKLPTKDNFSLDFMKKVVEFYDARDSTGRKKHTWKSTKHRFRTVPHQQYITRFRHYIEQHGTKREKLQIIDDFVYDKFEEARERVLPVHDHDLRRWARQKAADDSVLSFQASEHWLRNFKHRHRICSRKITKLVTRHQMEDSAAIAASADSFLANVKQEMSRYTPEEILNTDQMGLELEMHSTRTLSHQGEKITLARVKSKNSTTHSYTIQPMISLAGQLVGPIFLCLKEPKGKMSDSKLIDYLLLLLYSNSSFFRY